MRLESGLGTGIGCGDGEGGLLLSLLQENATIQMNRMNARVLLCFFITQHFKSDLNKYQSLINPKQRVYTLPLKSIRNVALSLLADNDVYHKRWWPRVERYKPLKNKEFLCEPPVFSSSLRWIMSQHELACFFYFRLVTKAIFFRKKSLTFSQPQRGSRALYNVLPENYNLSFNPSNTNKTNSSPYI